ncbi:hypothetical protein GCM10025881_19260 [Pseudolysinimonas kribbensis]|uniref:NAD-dependent epimerase/dehydratase domain-containing protein n=1 Tax=Pseudolysinimonas kribbensis TaxID=433641 RepID=A0ABQ6K8E9_9MICO|nr:hypothetical protein GCM10025881_19260 [Pseudolysinimonas kribbensis]
MTLRMLFIGGTGTISTSVSALALARGHDLTIVNRGTTPVPPELDGVKELRGDAGDPASIRDAVGDREFDVVVNFRAFHTDQVAADIETFRGRTGQYVFISSASAYQKPVERLPITESTPLRNPFWQYSREKIACEDLLVAAYRDSGFPMTIIRPSHTYTRNSVPIFGRWTAIERMRAGKPVVVQGDGTSLWHLTHSRDLAVALVGLLGNRRALGEAFHITGDEALTWNQIFQIIARAAGARSPSSCTSRARRSPGTIPTRARASSATRRTRCSSTTARSRRSCRSTRRRRRTGAAPPRWSAGTTPTRRAAGSTRRRMRCSTRSSRSTGAEGPALRARGRTARR